MTKQRKYTLDSMQLKLIGIALTLVEAVALNFFSGEAQRTICNILQFISYPAIGIFVFLLVEGWHNTGSLKRYALGLALAAVAAEPFYDYACIGSWLNYGASNGQNFLFSLLLCLFVLELLRAAEQSQKWKGFMIVSLILAIPFWAIMTNFHLSGIAMLLTVIFRLLREKPKARFYTALIAGTAFKLTGGLCAIPVHMYSGHRGAYNKYLFYGLYPVMWAVLAAVKLFTA